MDGIKHMIEQLRMTPKMEEPVSRANVADELERLIGKVSSLEFIIKRSSELLERGYRDEVQLYLSECASNLDI